MDYKSYRGDSPRRKKRHWLAAALLLLGLGLALFGALELVIAVHSRDRVAENPPPKVMVVFGCQMRRDGPSVLLRDRLDAAPYLEGWSAGAGANYGGFSSEEYDKLIAYARTAPEEKEDEAGEGASEADQTGDEKDAETELTLTRMETLHVIE